MLVDLNRKRLNPLMFPEDLMILVVSGDDSSICICGVSSVGWSNQAMPKTPVEGNPSWWYYKVLLPPQMFADTEYQYLAVSLNEGSYLLPIEFSMAMDRFGKWTLNIWGVNFELSDYKPNKEGRASFSSALERLDKDFLLV